MVLGRVGRCRTWGFALSCTSFCIALLVAAPVVAQDGLPRLVSLAAGGASAANAGASDDVDQDSISGDGRYVAFVSASTDLVAPAAGQPLPLDTNAATDVFLRDLETGVTTLVSRSIRPGALTGDGASGHARISRDGRFVVFTSHAGDLDPGDANGVEDVFVFDRQSATVERVSVSSAGAMGNNDSGLGITPRISRDGRTVVFASAATNLVPGTDANGLSDLFVRDREAGTTTLVTRNARGSAAARYDAPVRARYLFEPRVSPDGRYVAYGSFASDLVVGDVNNTSDTFLFDVASGLTVRVCPSPRHDANITPYTPAQFSGNSLHLVFDCDGIAAPGDFSGRLNVFRRYLVTGRTDVVSSPPGVTRGSNTGDSGAPATNYTGAVITFGSTASDLLVGATVIGAQLYARFMEDEAAMLLSATPSGQPGSPGTFVSDVSMSADGALVVFTSPSADLSTPAPPVEADDVYLRNRTERATVRVSVNVTGGDPQVFPNMLGASPAAISEDGSRIVFASRRANLAEGDGNGEADLFAAVAVPPTASGVSFTVANTQFPTSNPQKYETLTATFSWTNTGNRALPRVTLSVAVPPVATLAIDDVGEWTCAPGPDSGWCTREVGTLQSQQSGQASIRFTFDHEVLLVRAADAYQPPGSIVGHLLSEGLPLAVARGTYDQPVVVGPPSTAQEAYFRGCVALLLSLAGRDVVAEPPATAMAATAIDLALLYQVRELLRRTPEGLRYVDLYEQFSPALVRLFLQDATLLSRGITILVDWQEALRALVAGDGGSVPVTPARMATLSTFLNDVASAGPPELRAAILDELSRFPAADLGEMTVARAASRLGVHDGGLLKRYFAEGAATGFFRTVFGLANPGPSAVDAVMRFLTRAGQAVTHALTLPPLSRATVDAAEVPGLAPAEFSTVVESSQPLMADRTMSWDGSAYGSHGEAGLAAPSLTWYLAEGATHSGFDLFYLLQNPDPDQPAQVTVRYLLPSGAPLTKRYTVPPASRFNIWVDEELLDVGGVQTRALDATDVSATLTVTNGVPILVERAMYLTLPGQAFGAGHASAGVTSPGARWILAEGATGAYFDLFLLVANPTDRATRIRVSYLLPSGEVLTKDHDVAASSRFNIWVDHEELPAGSQRFPLADTPVSTIVESLDGVPIIVERAMWWPGPAFAPTWIEAHNSPGATSGGTLWALGDGEVGGPSQVETYVLVANVSAWAGLAKVTLLFDDETTATKYVPIAAYSRSNVAIGAEFPEAAGRRFGVTVESIGGPPPAIVVERAMYSNAGGTPWAAGTNALATRLR